MDMQELLDEQFDRAWDAGVGEAWIIVSAVLGSGPALDESKQRFIHELEMKEDE